jgi:hypothetical protein
MPAPTKVFEIVINTEPYTPDLTEVNDLASQGYDLQFMGQIEGSTHPGRFWFLLSRTVTAKEGE